MIDNKIRNLLQSDFSKGFKVLDNLILEKIPILLSDFRIMKGYTPNYNLVNSILLVALDYSNTQENTEINVSGMDAFLSPTYIRKLYNFEKSNLFDVAPCELMCILSELNVIGSDGCGGDFFSSYVSKDDNVYHTWVEYEGITLANKSVSYLLQNEDSALNELNEAVSIKYSNLFENVNISSEFHN